ncbi:uncharacterized protein VTP21DRAFT_4261 [Calcarisporiella thermophila]|uniref:uncharacterized protein n=1 Tax=Calcarisporiella thermophila TaxID=911321 RepID=UPI0037436A4D
MSTANVRQTRSRTALLRKVAENDENRSISARDAHPVQKPAEKRRTMAENVRGQNNVNGKEKPGAAESRIPLRSRRTANGTAPTSTAIRPVRQTTKKAAATKVDAAVPAVSRGRSSTAMAPVATASMYEEAQVVASTGAAVRVGAKRSIHAVIQDSGGVDATKQPADDATLQAAREHEQAEELNRRIKRQKSQDWDDLDADDADDPFMVSEYVVDIFEYLRKLELETMPDPNYMDRQKELAWKMRGILVDWLIEVHAKFKLLPETLFLTVNIIDRFLSRKEVSLVKLQLVGITAMFIAAKYEEIVAPSIQNFLYMVDSSYSDEEILKAERYVLQVLGFRLCYPNPMNFLRRVSKADNYDIQTRTVAKYLLEIPLLDHQFLKYPPSILAAAAMLLSRKMLNRSEWDANLVHYSCGYTEEDLKEVVDLMLDYLSKPPRHTSFFKKYASKKFMRASPFVQKWVEENHTPK